MSESGAERIQINPQPVPMDGTPYLRVIGPTDDGEVDVQRLKTWPSLANPKATTTVCDNSIKMHQRDWCALMDWWAVNFWGMEGDEDSDEGHDLDASTPA